jgi:hypothetical protein
VHLWYPEKFGRAYPPVSSTREALTRFLAPACAVGVRWSSDGPEALAPFGWEDVFVRLIRRNPAVSGSSAEYDAKAARWKSKWPEITVEPWAFDPSGP